MPSIAKTPAQKRTTLWCFAGAGLLLLLLMASLGGLPFVPSGASPTTIPAGAPTSPPPGGDCGSQPWFYARDTEGNQFGPAAPEEVSAAQAEFAKRRCVDPALLIADTEYLTGQFSDPAARVAKTQELLANPQLWKDQEALFTARLAQAQKVEVVTMSGSYQTMDMVDAGRPIPEIYQIPVDKPSFKVLQFTWEDGTVKSFKLNCGFQPVEKSFSPNVPGTPPAPSPNQPTAPVVPGKPGGHKPPTPTVPPTVPPKPGKCANQGQYCGDPMDPHPLDHVGSNPQPSTPGAGNPETVIPAQPVNPSSTPGPTTPYGTNTGGGQVGPTNNYSGTGASNPTPGTNGGVTNDAAGSAATSNNGGVGQTTNTMLPQPG